MTSPFLNVIWLVISALIIGGYLAVAKRSLSLASKIILFITIYVVSIGTGVPIAGYFLEPIGFLSSIFVVFIVSPVIYCGIIELVTRGIQRKGKTVAPTLPPTPSPAPPPPPTATYAPASTLSPMPPMASAPLRGRHILSSASGSVSSHRKIDWNPVVIAAIIQAIGAIIVAIVSRK